MTVPERAVKLHLSASALQDDGRLDDATARYESALALAPDYVEAHVGLGTCLLLQGNFERGWLEYEWRLQMDRYAAHRALSAPFWDGSDLAGRTVLLYAEQGHGDTLQFIRYAPKIVERAKHVMLACPVALHRLFRQFQIDIVRAPFPDFDVHAPLLSLPRLLGAPRDTLAGSVPYAQADSGLVAAWQAQLARATGKRVGLAWCGNPKHEKNQRRSIPLPQLTPLAQAGITLISLQQGIASNEVASADVPLLNVGPLLTDFADTAAVVCQLDLVITVDTVIAHLAGALGVPVWILLPHAPDWRWLMDGSDSAWYPTARLFRQIHAGDWEAPIVQAAAALAANDDSAGTSASVAPGWR